MEAVVALATIFAGCALVSSVCRLFFRTANA